MVDTDELIWPDTVNNNNNGQTLPTIGSDLKQEEKLVITDFITKYNDVFLDELVPGGAKVELMNIIMKTEWNMDKLKTMRRYAPVVEAALQYELQAQLNAGIIEESGAIYVAPVHMVKKEGSETGFRFCIDYKETNKYVTVIPYSLPNIQTILNSISGSQYFAKFNLNSGYWQFPVAEEYRHKLAFQVQGSGNGTCSVIFPCEEGKFIHFSLH